MPSDCLNSMFKTDKGEQCRCEFNKPTEEVGMKIEKLHPVCKNYIWGGSKLKEKYGKISADEAVAESWELSFHKDGKTLVEGGETLESVCAEHVGDNAKDFPMFPVLIKLIDAKDNLSVQVHPSDSYALANEGEFGKTEMWYIVEADEGAGIYLGLSRDVTSQELTSAIEEGRLVDLLNFIPVRAGECYFIPAGTIHAICRGCLICEIQQNSNLTYRVYDYLRRDKDGNLRELHVNKACRVANLSKFVEKKFPEGILGMSKYFTVRRHSVSDRLTLFADTKSFRSFTCVCGSGELEGEEVRAGDSFFIPAGYGTFTLKGKMEIIMTEIRKYYVGIDLGGTFIKGGIVDDLGRLIISDKVPTESALGATRVAENIANLVKKLLSDSGLEPTDVVGIGMGVPGMIDSERGEVIYSNNLAWEHFPIAKEVEARCNIKVKIANDANVAALGETLFGCGKEYKSTILLTLGTGVGGGIVMDGKLVEGNRSAGAELGHSVISAGGEACTCGRRGCLEAYASATALIRDTKRAMEQNPKSKMWEIGSVDNATGKTAFDYYADDESAKAVVDRYIYMLGTGIVNLANELRPEAVILGGGVCAQGENLTRPLTKVIDDELFAGKRGPEVKLLIATLGNTAGILGAAALNM